MGLAIVADVTATEGGVPGRKRMCAYGTVGVACELSQEAATITSPGDGMSSPVINQTHAIPQDVAGSSVTSFKP